MSEKLRELEACIEPLLPAAYRPAPFPQELYPLLDCYAAEVKRLADEAGPIPLSESDVHRGSELFQRTVFILGFHRSGTTLLRNLLDGHSRLGVLPSEGNFLTNFHPNMKRMDLAAQVEQLCEIWLKRFIHSVLMPPYWLVGKSQGEEHPAVLFYRRARGCLGAAENKWSVFKPWNAFLPIVFAYLEQLPNAETMTCWVDKSPRQELKLKELVRTFPRAKFLCLDRPKEEIFQSLENLYRAAGAAFDQSKELRAFKKCRSAVVGFQQRNPGVVRSVQFERLVQDRERVMKGIAQFLEIPFEDILLEPTVQAQPTGKNSSASAG